MERERKEREGEREKMYKRLDERSKEEIAREREERDATVEG